MIEKEKTKKKPVKYDDAETKKPGSPIETPYKHGDMRNKKQLKQNIVISDEERDIAKLDDDPVIKLNSSGELKIAKAND